MLLPGQCESVEEQFPRLTAAQGLSSLADLQKKAKMDVRRHAAAVGLEKSMGTWIARKTPTYGTVSYDDTIPAGFAMMQAYQAYDARAGSKMSVGSMVDESMQNLEQAFLAHVANFDLDGDGTIDVEELILIFDRCSLFDETFTPNKVRNYFKTLLDGCNHVRGLTNPMGEVQIGYEEFKDVLRFAADMKTEPIQECVLKVIRLSRKLCDKEAAVPVRLRVVFEAFAMKDHEHMFAFEFAKLCDTMQIYEEDRFTRADVYLIFYRRIEDVHGVGVDFDGFMGVLAEVGQRLDIGEEVHDLFAKAVELLDTDGETISRVKVRLRQAASIVGGKDWAQFFLECDPDGSGSIDWDEFLAMCREKLHLAERDNHLKILFDRLDEDGSGELDISELIAFISS